MQEERGIFYSYLSHEIGMMEHFVTCGIVTEKHMLTIYRNLASEMMVLTNQDCISK